MLLKTILVIIVLTVTAVTSVNGAIQLEANESTPVLFDEEFQEDLKKNYSSINVVPFMEDEEKMYPRRWRADNVEETEKDDEKQSLEEEGFVVYEEDGRRRSTETVLRHFSKYNNSYVLLAPLVARPTSIYRLVVLIYAADDRQKEISLRASMSSSDSGNELTFAEGTALVGESSELMMKLPDALPGPFLKLRVEAHQGSNLLFINTTLVQPHPDFLTIVIFMSRVAFTQDQRVAFRVILMTSDLLPYQDPVDVFILDPSGYIVKRWVSRVPNTGLVDLEFQSPLIPLAGFWRVRVKAKSQVKDHPFLIITYHIGRFEVISDMDSFILASDENITGVVEGYGTNDATVYGNMTLTLWAKYPANASDSHYKEITTEVYDYVEGGDEFSFPMTLLQGHVPQLVGTEVKVESLYMDHLTGITLPGYIKSRIISGDVIVKFVEQTPVIFRPGMPLTLSVNVAYDDTENIAPEDLASASLRITSSVVIRNGGSIQLPDQFIPPEVQDVSESEHYFAASDNEILNINVLKNRVNQDSFREYYNVSDYSESFDGNELYFRNARYEALLAKETYVLKSKFTEFRTTGIFTFTLQIPEDTTSLTVNAVYTDGEGATTGDKIDGISNFNPKGRQLHVTSSTEKGAIGEFAIFHVRTNFPLEKFHYVVMSKGLFVHSATEAVEFSGAEGVATVALAVSREMFPLMTFVAYHIDLKGDLTADSIKIPIELPTALNASVFINQHKDHKKLTIELVAKAPAGSYVAVSCSREASYQKHSTSRLTKEKFIMEALSMEPFPGTVSRVNRQPRNSAEVPTVHLLLSGDTEGDAVRTLQVSGLASLSDTRFRSSSQFLGRCEMSLGLLECGDGTCYQMKDVCNGVKNCADGSDEYLCQYQFVPYSSYEDGVDETIIYLLFRWNWYKDFFDTEDGYFVWTGDFIGHNQNSQLILEVPKTQDDWLIEGVAVHPALGIAFIDPIPYVTNPPVFAVLEGPTICRRGESVSIRIALYNSMNYDVIILLIVPESEDFEFIHVEDKGVVDFFRPRTSSGEHQHIVFMKPEGNTEVFIPLAIKKQVGTVEVIIKVSSIFALDEESWEIEVKPEGAPVRKHTSVLLDLKNRALFYEFLNIPVDESPIIQNRVIRRFVAGSPQASLTMSGDVFGPMTEDIFVNCETTFNGRSLKGTDGHAFNFGATIWTLHYLRLTNQLLITDATGAFDFLNTQMASILTRIINGGYKMWHFSGPSVWLTAWVTNLFQKAMLEDWENLIYVDTRVLTDAVHFMIQFQEPNGNFRETEFYNITLDRKYQYQTRNYGKNVTIGLTALVTATIKEVLDALPGRTRTLANDAIGKAQRFLERSLPSMKDPYDIAITAFALSVIGSSEKDVAVSMLLDIVRSQDGLLYWSTKPVKGNDRIHENNQRTFIQPKEPQEWDAAAIEATSYALLVLLNQEGVTIREERIVNWLITVRDWDLAFDATSDSVIALRALTEYCYRARLRDVTDLNIDVESSADPDFNEQIRIEKPFVSTMQLLEIPNPWGHVLLTGRGAGQALAQLTVTWGVDVSDRLERPPRKYFSLNINEYHHQARNKSRITTTVCTSWTATDFGPTSHAAMVEVEVPTGYFLHQPEANKVAKDAILEGTFPEMRDVLCTEAYIYFQFVYIPPYEQCFKYDLQRWHPVANLTRTRSAMIFELFAPEHFEQIILNSTTLSALDICEVCGSYQCPYCMFYSRSHALESSFMLIAFSLLGVIEMVSFFVFDHFTFITRLFSFRIV